MLLVHFFIGAIAMACLAFLVDFTRKNEITLKWWGWLVTVLGVLYAAFVLEVIAGFLGEGAPRAALVMGLVTGIVAVIWGVLLSRFVIKKA